MQLQGQRILIAPLDWGLGHASRCIPIICRLNELGAEVFIAAQGEGEALLKKYFPTAKFIALPGFKATHPSNGNMTWHLFKRLPSLIASVIHEHFLLKQLIEQYGLNGVVSDNRYGLWSIRVPSVFITHQINIKAPVVEKLINCLNHWFIGHFDYCWIPDIENRPSLSEELGHPLPPYLGWGKEKKVGFVYIGWLSRFNLKNASNQIKVQMQHWEFDLNTRAGLIDKTIALLGIVSGPEPQRTAFEFYLQKEAKQAVQNDLIVKIFGGKPSQVQPLDEEFREAVHQAQKIIARPGYSTLMDILCIQTQARMEWIPTAGQPEQLYLNDCIKANWDFLCREDVREKAFDTGQIDKALVKAFVPSS